MNNFTVATFWKFLGVKSNQRPSTDGFGWSCKGIAELEIDGEESQSNLPYSEHV